MFPARGHPCWRPEPGPRTWQHPKLTQTGIGKTNFLPDHRHNGRWGHFCFHTLLIEVFLPFGSMVPFNGHRFNNYTASQKVIPHPCRTLPRGYHFSFPIVRPFLCWYCLDGEEYNTNSGSHSDGSISITLTFCLLPYCNMWNSMPVGQSFWKPLETEVLQTGKTNSSLKYLFLENKPVVLQIQKGQTQSICHQVVGLFL